ncbi:MAG: WGR domain-containing protein, partial [Candidatus Eremiobacterota bacterium]
MLRRLEFSEGNSDKFWEVEVEGCQVTTRWGRIGTAGQSKTKSHPTEAAAEGDARQQAEAKLKKGYREVAAAAVATATEPSTSPHPTPDALWTKAFPRRSCPPPSGKLPSADALLKKLKTRLKQAELWRLGVGVTLPRLRPALREAVREVTQARVPVQAEVQQAAVLAAMLPEAADDVVDYLVARAGVTFALRSLSAALELEPAESHNADGRPQFLWVVPGDEEEPFWHADALAGWPRLRYHLATADERDYRAALHEATGMRATGSSKLRCRLAFAFPEQPEWAASEVHSCLNNLQRHYGMTLLPHYAWCLLSSLSDPTLAEKLLFCSQNRPTPEHAVTLLVQLGAPAVPLILRLVSEGIQGRETWLEALLERPDREVARGCKAFLEERPLRPRVAAYYLRFPEVGVEALAQACSAGKAREAARTLLGRLLRSLDGIPESVTGKERELCQNLLASLAPAAPEASPDQLPAVLVSPPWLAASKPSAKSAKTPR